MRFEEAVRAATTAELEDGGGGGDAGGDGADVSPLEWAL